MGSWAWGEGGGSRTGMEEGVHFSMGWDQVKWVEWNKDEKGEGMRAGGWVGVNDKEIAVLKSPWI